MASSCADVSMALDLRSEVPMRLFYLDLIIATYLHSLLLIF